MTIKKLVIANWKQNKTFKEAENWCDEFVRLAGEIGLKKADVVVCPPTPFLEQMSQDLKSAGVALGVQDISPFADGPHTGCVGVNQVSQFCTYAIIGHSERQEDRELVLQKAQFCLTAGIVPIVCFKSSEQYKIINGAVYVLEDPKNISQNGIYRAKDIDGIKKMAGEAKIFFGEASTVLYGGSVNQENARELASIADINGVLVGNASLNPGAFADIVGKFSL